MFYLMCPDQTVANSRDADDLRRNGAHCDVTVMQGNMFHQNNDGDNLHNLLLLTKNIRCEVTLIKT